jgi:hypothetical protein
MHRAAQRIGADVFSLINWEKGETEPAIRFWPAIIAYLGYDPSPLPVTLGDHIRAERRRRGCNLALLARERGVDPGTLALIEADTYPRIDSRVRASYKARLGRHDRRNPMPNRMIVTTPLTAAANADIDVRIAACCNGPRR